MEKKRSNFTGSIGFVLAAAGSAVGLGNIWRFPYLAAKGGGGVFILCYVVLALTFGFTLLTTEIAIGRKTGQSPLTAYEQMHKGWGGIGVLACAVPTNLPLKEIKNETMLDKRRIYDRILEMCTPMYVGGTSKREAIASMKMQKAKTLLNTNRGEEESE